MRRIRETRARTHCGSQAGCLARSASPWVAPLGRRALSIMAGLSPTHTDPTTGLGDM